MIRNSPRLRITLVSASLRRGGAERVLSTLAAEFAKRHDVTFITQEERHAGDYPLLDSVTYVSLASSGNSRNILEAVIANIRRISTLRRALRGTRPDVVVSFIHRMNVKTLLAALGTGIPVIVSERSDPVMAPLSASWRALRWLLYRTAARVVCQTETAARWMCRLADHRRVVVIPNPVRPVLPDASGPPAFPRAYIIGVGRLSHEKGFDLLLRAFAQSGVARSHDLVLVGEGGARADLGRLAESLGIAPQVRFTGQVANPDPFIAGADIFVLSSRFEGFPNVLLEAMSHGRCVVAFDCRSGPSDIVTDKVDGLLVANGEVAALAGALAQAAADESLRTRLGAAARQVSRTFSLATIAERWEAELRGVVTPGDGPRNV